MARIVDLPEDDPVTSEATDLGPSGGAASTVAGLFKAQAGRVRRLLKWRLHSEDDAQDATQDLFLRLWKHERQGSLADDARSYLFSSMYNAAVDVERWRAHHRPDERLSLEDVDLPSRDPEPGEALFWRDALHLFVDVLNELPPLTQQVFMLYHVEGLPHTAIAERIGMTVRTVERHMARALAHCKERMKDYVG